MASWSSTTRVCSLAAAAVVAFTGCGHRALPAFGPVPDFKLTAQSGAEFNSSSLKGSVWVADFFFTNCTGPCPRMSSRLRQIAKTFSSRKDLKLVSFTVDPQRDTVPVLAEYANKFSAQPGRWYFLTGPMERLNQLGRNVFLLGDVNGSLEHSTRFVLVDRKRQIRGFYHSNDADSMQQLVRDIRLLLKESA